MSATVFHGGIGRVRAAADCRPDRPFCRNLADGDEVVRAVRLCRHDSTALRSRSTTHHTHAGIGNKFKPVFFAASALRKASVLASLGKIEVGHQAQLPCGDCCSLGNRERCNCRVRRTPMIFPTPPLTVSFCRSVEDDIHRSDVRLAERSGEIHLQHLRHRNFERRSAMTVAASSPPTPMAIMPMPPRVGVWLSVPRPILPGAAKRSRCT